MVESEASRFLDQSSSTEFDNTQQQTWLLPGRRFLFVLTLISQLHHMGMRWIIDSLYLGCFSLCCLINIITTIYLFTAFRVK